MNPAPSFSVALLSICLLPILPVGWSPGSDARADTGPEAVPLPKAESWETDSAVARETEGRIEVEFPVNYVVGRVASPEVSVKGGDLFTFAADIATEFPPNQASFYRFWLSLEFLEDGKVVETASSGEIVGVQEAEALLGVTGIAPAAATHVRAVLLGQNKYWNPLKNRAVVKDVRLLKLSGKPGDVLKIEETSSLPVSKEARTTSLAVTGDWPDGTAVKMASTTGQLPKAVLMSGGRSELTLAYDAEKVGSAEVTAQIGSESANALVPDPFAGILKIDAVLADGLTTPALVRLSRDGDMLPGRYQSSVPGIFIVPPYAAELAPGTWQLEVSRGPQFETLKREFRVGSGKTEPLGKLELPRRVDLREDGWYGGDADGDVYHGEQIYTDVTPRTAADIARAMGLDWVGVGGWGRRATADSPSRGYPSPGNWAEARKKTESLGGSDLLFMWTEERPKTKQGHACFLGMRGPDDAKLGSAWTSKRPMENFEVLQGIRAYGGATFVNHPLRWWMKGDRFNTNMYGSLAFDLCAAAALDGFNINEGDTEIGVWSMLLDRGYRVAATAGADFCLDRPSGPLPGKARMYCYAPEGMSEASLSEAVRKENTIVSTGPVLRADIDGAPPGSTVSSGKKHTIQVEGWARGDRSDPLQRLELFAHGKVLAEHELGDSESATKQFEWQPSGESDWVAVRLVSKSGWAMTSAFYADGKKWRPDRPVDCELTLDVQGLDPGQAAEAKVEVWSRAPDLFMAERLRQVPLADATTLIVPVTATVVLQVPGEPTKEVNVFDLLGVREIVDGIAAGGRHEKPLLEWETYQLVLDRCRTAILRVEF